MFETYGLPALIAGLVGLAGLVLLLVPPSQHAVRSWLSVLGGGGADETVVAVRGAVLRMSYVGAGVFVLVTVLGLFAQFRATSAAIALALATVVAAGVRVESGTRRRADITAHGVPDAGASRLLIAATGLAVVVFALGILLAVLEAGPGGPGSSSWFPESSSVLPAVEYYTMPTVAAAAVLVTVITWLAYRRVLRRQSLAGVDSNVDHALRRASIRRISVGALSCQILLLSTMVMATPLLARTIVPDGSGGTPSQVDAQAVTAASGVALALVILGLVIAAAALAAPFWAAAARQARLIKAGV
ncbi:hypothetical protein [Promicromonospora sp. NPDC023805]|uniref:hypothetical protein n=1 Tax=Promicromonospora sp. NPDC023805 TaxID=3154696 RepID=UPI0033F58237